MSQQLTPLSQNSAGAGQGDPNIGICCLALSRFLGPKVSFPDTQQYNSSIASYFSQQNSDLHPRCIVSPSSAEDVSVAISILTSTAADLDDPIQKSHCHFAIRSGGHATVTGASNIAEGITIDLQGLKTIQLNDERSTVSVGAGATWGDVYSALDPLGLSAVGGRAQQVGVGGLTLGGGISYLSPRYGWACDMVSNFEIVLANGTIVNANDDHNAELARGLRGGAGNLGVVTRLDLNTVKQGPFWGGSVYYKTDTINEQLKAFVDLNSAENYDEFASLITSFGFAAGQGAAVVNSLEYTKAEANPPVFRPFTEIPSLASTMRISTMHNITTEQGSFSPNGKRELSVTTTYASTVPILNATYVRWNTSLAAVKDIPGIVWSISLEPLPPAIYSRQSKKNILGLSNASGSLVVVELSGTWDQSKDDATAEKAARVLVDGIEEDARKLGVYEPFEYVNYAAPWQQPIKSYGHENVEKLKRLSRDVDPTGIFQYMAPGGFKIKD